MARGSAMMGLSNFGGAVVKLSELGKSTVQNASDDLSSMGIPKSSPLETREWAEDAGFSPEGGAVLSVFIMKGRDSLPIWRIREEVDEDLGEPNPNRTTRVGVSELDQAGLVRVTSS